MSTLNRAHLNFENFARKSFEFLNDLGFVEIESSPTVIRYRKDSVEVNVYHGRQSYEIGGGVSRLGTQYSLLAIIRTADPAAAQKYRYPVATTPREVAAGLEEAGYLMRRHGVRVLGDDPQFFSELESELENDRQLWLEEYALDALVEKIRPKASKAF